jgi:ubiquinone/menaquinone biosynthesis C-methylase UbiE
MEQAFELDPAVLAYYDEGREHARLETDRLELLRTQELLARYLPPPPARVLDVGGGAGVHAVPLIRSGYEVTLLDPVALHVEQARAAGVMDVRLGDARRLPFDDASFDAALLLGPLYHLVDRDDRVGALRESARVVCTDGLVLAAAISRFASAYDGLRQHFLDDPDFQAVVGRDLASGLHVNPQRHRGWFTTAYFHRPEELPGELEDAGLACEALLAIEGPGSFLVDAEHWLDDPGRCEVLLRIIRQVESEPSLLGASAHLLAVGRAA